MLVSVGSYLHDEPSIRPIPTCLPSSPSQRCRRKSDSPQARCRGKCSYRGRKARQWSGLFRCSGETAKFLRMADGGQHHPEAGVASEFPRNAGDAELGSMNFSKKRLAIIPPASRLRQARSPAGRTLNIRWLASLYVSKLRQVARHDSRSVRALRSGPSCQRQPFVDRWTG
jgi:hypothetical protein